MERWTKTFAAMLVAGAVLVAAGCASSTQQQQQAQVAQANGEAEDPKEELVCRREHRTGTNISTRVCYTREQVDTHAVDRRERDQQQLLDMPRWGCSGESCESP